MARWMRQRTLNLAVQAIQLRRHFPDSHATIRKSQLTWLGKIMPSPLSAMYTVRIRYRLQERPDVDLVDPKLETRDGKRPPHLFPGDKLCLCLPNEWHGNMLLVNTIVPWAAEWLAHYEIWLATGEWCGGGVHPNLSPDRKADTEPTATSERPRGSRSWDARHRPR